jgi:hypothetical protein
MVFEPVLEPLRVTMNGRIWTSIQNRPDIKAMGSQHRTTSLFALGSTKGLFRESWSEPQEIIPQAVGSSRVGILAQIERCQ